MPPAPGSASACSSPRASSRRTGAASGPRPSLVWVLPSILRCRRQPNRSLADEVVTSGEAHQLDERVQLELLEDAGAMSLHRLDADAQTLCDRVVGEATHQEVEDLALARRQLVAGPGLAVLAPLELEPIFHDGARDQRREIHLAPRH